MSYYGKRNELIDQVGLDTIAQYYYTHTKRATAIYFNVDINTISGILQRYHIHKTKEQKRKSLQLEYDLDEFYRKKAETCRQTQINKYGSLENMYSKRKEKTKNTRINKYGSVEAYKSSMVSNIEKTIEVKYGVTNISKLPEIKDKKKITLISHYGSLKSAYDQRQIKINDTLIRKYGSLENYRSAQQNLAKETYYKRFKVDNPFKSLEIQQKIKQTCLEKYGVEFACMIPSNRSNGAKDSKPNLEFSNLLDSYGIKYDREFILNNYIYDFKVNNILIEIDPFATHNSL